MSRSREQSTDKQASGFSTGNFKPPTRRRLVAAVYEIGLLLIVLYTVISESPLAIDPDSKLVPLSVLGMAIDTNFLLLAPVSMVLKLLTCIAIGMWLLKQGGRWIYIAAPALFIAFMSTVVESQYFVRHQSHFCAMAFVLLGAARFSGTRKSDDSNQSTKPVVDPLPGWCFMLMVYYIGLSYTFSGIAKLCYSGIGWANGSSLMMWVESMASGRDNLLFDLLTNHHWLASALQTTTLAAELFAIVILLAPRLRPVFGLVFVGFHMSIEILFGYGFFANIFLDTYILIVCFMVPEYRTTGFQFFRELLSTGPTELFSPDGANEAME